MDHNKDGSLRLNQANIMYPLIIIKAFNNKKT
jgi:hypothetical protein